LGKLRRAAIERPLERRMPADERIKAIDELVDRLMSCRVKAYRHRSAAVDARDHPIPRYLTEDASRDCANQIGGPSVVTTHPI